MSRGQRWEDIDRAATDQRHGARYEATMRQLAADPSTARGAQRRATAKRLAARDERTLEERHLDDVADRFTEDPELEKLARLADEHPDRYDRLNPTMKMSLGFYLQDKATAAEAAARDGS